MKTAIQQIRENLDLDNWVINEKPFIISELKRIYNELWVKIPESNYYNWAKKDLAIYIREWENNNETLHSREFFLLWKKLQENWIIPLDNWFDRWKKLNWIDKEEEIETRIPLIQKVKKLVKSLLWDK